MKWQLKWAIAPMVIFCFLAASCSSSAVRQSSQSKADSSLNSELALAASQTPPPNALVDPPLLDLDSKSAVELLSIQTSGEQHCQDRHQLETQEITDLAEIQPGHQVPLINTSNSELFAQAAAGVVYKSYEVLARSWAKPEPESLLCIARLTIQPRLEAEWANLSFLIERNWYSSKAKTPSEIWTLGVRSGEALVAGCIGAEPYGKILNSLGELVRVAQEAPLIFTARLVWAGGRYRIQTLKDFNDMDCRDLKSLAQFASKEITGDLNAGIEDWILHQDSWKWTKKELEKWLNI